MAKSKNISRLPKKKRGIKLFGKKLISELLVRTYEIDQLAGINWGKCEDRYGNVLLAKSFAQVFQCMRLTVSTK
jgi:hypothetical protein